MSESIGILGMGVDMKSVPSGDSVFGGLGWKGWKSRRRLSIDDLIGCVDTYPCAVGRFGGVESGCVKGVGHKSGDRGSVSGESVG